MVGAALLVRKGDDRYRVGIKTPMRSTISGLPGFGAQAINLSGKRSGLGGN